MNFLSAIDILLALEIYQQIKYLRFCSKTPISSCGVDLRPDPMIWASKGSCWQARQVTSTEDLGMKEGYL